MTSSDVVVVGYAVRVPGAETVPDLWRIVSEGRDVITRASANVGATSRTRVHAYGRLVGFELFDPEFFGYSRRDAEDIDPQQRVLLECALETLESACVKLSATAASVGVFTSVGLSTYLLNTWSPHSTEAEELASMIGCDNHYASGRISYKLGLTGPAVSVGSACSSSLLAIHMAARSIAGGECGLALAGGVDIEYPQPESYVYQRDGILSATGVCRPFDQNADGTVFGSGGGVVLLTTRGLAEAMRLPIRAVMLASAVNNDGAEKASFTAPRAARQADVIRSAYRKAGFERYSPMYLECHGTGTQLGDRSELSAIAQVLDPSGTPVCLGSVKANLGHLRVGAGVVGFIKACEIASRGVIPPCANLTTPTDALGTLNAETPRDVRERDSEPSMNIVGVSSFGFGGTNVHAVVAGHARASSSRSRGKRGMDRYPVALRLSAPTPDSCVATGRAVADALEADTALAVTDAAFTLDRGRNEYDFRYVALGGSRIELLEALRGGGTAVEHWKSDSGLIPGLAFGSESFDLIRMGQELHGWDRSFTRALKRIWSDLQSIAGPTMPPLAGVFGRDSSELSAAESTGLYMSICLALVEAMSERGLSFSGFSGTDAGVLAARVTAGELDLMLGLRLALSGEFAGTGPVGDRRDRRTSGEPAVVHLRVGSPLPATSPTALPRDAEFTMFVDTVSARMSYLRLLAELWCAGAEVSLDPSFTGLRCRYVDLPKRRLDSRPYLKESSSRGSATALLSSELPAPSIRREPSLDRWTYQPSWRLRRRPPGRKPRPEDRWLVLSRDELGAAVVAKLVARGEDVVCLTPQNAPPGDREAIRRALEDLNLAERPVSRIVHLWCAGRLVDSPDLDSRLRSVEKELQFGLYTILHLLQAVVALQGPHAVTLEIVGRGVHPVDAESNSIPERAFLVAPALVAPQDLPFIEARSIDISGLASASVGVASEQITAELTCHDDDAPAVALEPSLRWIRGYEREFLPLPENGIPKRLRHKGVYLITGGLGGIGLTLADYLANTCQARLILTGLEVVPASELIERPWLPLPSDELLAERVRRLRRLVEAGAEVVAVKCDIGDVDATLSLFDRIDREFGELHGVVHAAGVFETQRAFRGVDETTTDECVRRLWPKVRGTMVLSEALRGRRLDFLLTQSSLSAHLGGLGFYAYTAGNAFMDSFTDRHRSGDLPWMTMNWDGWLFHERDETATSGRSVISSAFASPDFGVVAEIAVRPSEGARIFAKFLHMETPHQVLVSTSDFEERIDQWVHRHDFKAVREQQTLLATEPDPLGPRGGDLADIERYVAEVWSEVLGVHDLAEGANFFVLGGDSLHGLDVVFKVSQRYGVSLSVISMFDNPTIEAFAQVVQTALSEGDRSADEVPADLTIAGAASEQ
jgi:acyl transferase domain-containing protein